MNMFCKLRVAAINFTAIPFWVVFKKSKSLKVMHQRRLLWSFQRTGSFCKNTDKVIVSF